MPKSIVKVVAARKTLANCSSSNKPPTSPREDAEPITLARSNVLWQAQELLNRAQSEDDIRAARALLRGVQQAF